MDLFVSKSLPLVLVSLSLVAISLSLAAAESKNELPSPLDKRSEEHPRTASNLQFAKNDTLVGLQDPFFWFLAPLYAFIAVGITVVLNYLVMIILHTGQAIYSAFCSIFGRSNHERRHTPNTTVFSASSPRRRIIVTAFLLLFVATIVPYQFAYMVACLVQLATCIRALKYAKENVRVSLPNSRDGSPKTGARDTASDLARYGTFTTTLTRFSSSCCGYYP